MAPHTATEWTEFLPPPGFWHTSFRCGNDPACSLHQPKPVYSQPKPYGISGGIQLSAQTTGHDAAMSEHSAMSDQQSSGSVEQQTVVLGLHAWTLPTAHLSVSLHVGK